jgi:hypothetical protein
MNEDIYGMDTVVLGGYTDDDTTTLTSWNSPLSTSLSTDYSYTATLGTPSSITSGGGGITTAGGGSGATLSTTMNTGLLWNSGAPTYTNQTTGWTTYNQSQVLKVAGDAEFEGEVTIRGVKLDDRLTAIEERLGILRPNNDLEGKWEKLKALGEEYRRIEKEILEGEDIWATLKK